MCLNVRAAAIPTLLIALLINMISAISPIISNAKTYAIVIGISKYQNVPSLNHADKDAISFYNYLLSSGGGIKDTNDVKLFINENATSYNIVSAMEYLMGIVNENDKIYFYFAGHGDVENKSAYKLGYLLCSTSPKTCYPAGGCLDMNYLQVFAKTLIDKKDTVVLVLDACRAGNLLAGGDDGKIAFSVAVNEWKGITKILSCQPGESSYEYNNLGNGGAGVFTYYLIRGLKGLADYNHDGFVTLEEIGDYLKESVKKITAKERKTQRPIVCCDIDKVASRVDSNELAELMKGEANQDYFYIASSEKGFLPDTSNINEEDVLLSYDKFNSLLKENKLLQYDSTESKEENAFSIYIRLKDNKKAKAVLNSMKNNLIAALMNNSQIITNLWFESKYPSRELWFKHQKELYIAQNIIDSNSILYNHVKASYLFFTYDQLGPYVEVEKILRKCIEFEPNNPCYYFNLATHQNENDLHDSALKNLNIALELSPKWSWVWNSIGVSLVGKGKILESINYFEKAIEISPDLEVAWSNKAYWLLQLGRYNESMIAADKTIELKNDSWTAWYIKGLILQQISKFIEAINCFDKSIEIDPDNVYSWINKGIALAGLSKYDEALKCYDKAIAIYSDNQEVWTLKSIALAKLNKKAEALKCSDKALSINPKECSSLYNRACMFAIMNEKDKMIETLKIVFKCNNDLKKEPAKDVDFKEYWEDKDFQELLK